MTTFTTSRRRAATVAFVAASLVAAGPAGAAPGKEPRAEPKPQGTVEVQILGLNETHGQLTRW